MNISTKERANITDRKRMKCIEDLERLGRTDEAKRLRLEHEQQQIIRQQYWNAST